MFYNIYNDFYTKKISPDGQSGQFSYMLFNFYLIFSYIVKVCLVLFLTY
nr:MAG TPA: hypothetical protein [Caudoviricetes sp.]